VALATEPYTTVEDALPLPPVGPDDGLLRVEAAAICGTDWEIYGRRSRGAGLGPLILGHENVGRVAAVGERAAARWGVAPGDRVAVEEFLPCGACRLCLAGHSRMCPATDSRGAGPFLRYGSTPAAVAPGLYGGFAEYLYLHPRAILHQVPDGVAPELAALYVPVANGIRWVRREGRLPPGGTLVVLGAGQHGLGCVVAGHQAGAGMVVAVDTAAGAARLGAALALGADHVVEADRAGAVAAVAGLTGGAGADVVVDLVPGEPSTVADAIAMAATRGRVILAASKHGRPVEAFQHDLAVRKELALVAVRGHDHASVEAALRTIASGRYPLARLCTHRFPLSRAGEALRMAGERPDPGAIHVSVVPEQEG